MEKTELTENSRKNELSKKFVMLIVMAMLFTCAVFAQSTGSGSGSKESIDAANTIKDVFQTIYTFFTSAAVRVIAIAGVIITGIKIITNKGNPDAAKPLIWIFIACIIIGGASWFVGKFLGKNIGDVTNMGGTSWY